MYHKQDRNIIRKYQLTSVFCVFQLSFYHVIILSFERYINFIFASEVFHGGNDKRN